MTNDQLELLASIYRDAVHKYDRLRAELDQKTEERDELELDWEEAGNEMVSARRELLEYAAPSLKTVRTR